MSLEMLDEILQGATYVLLGTWAICNILRRQAIPRTEARFVLATLTITAGVVFEAVLAGRAAIMFLQGDVIVAGIWVFPMFVISLSIREAFRDRNWFNNQFKKLKQGFKDLATRLRRIRVALPSPLPAPA